ncbi:hypothetical protein MB46_19280 (plasmid) [Arthrobacter alpinus]|uniref:hypothetical protein n=1 Tax=Arthrobacter alpinus TaxID=656366 RepID=UPI0005CB0E37|nr:hypothetical protein [Arthrobacter alpinus]ALV47822.1 hypothetical protein MB46_19280 [Arthrobacter alpinus]
MTTRITRLEDVDYYLPLYDEEGDMDHVAFYHRNILVLGRDFGLPGVSDWTAHEVMTTFPKVEHFSQATPDVQAALIVLGLAIDSFDPNNPSTTALIDRATGAVHALLTTK